MDLIYTDANGEDVGVLQASSFDEETGEPTNNNFTCAVVQELHCCDYGSRIYFEDHENGKVIHTGYGGIVDAIAPNTNTGTISYSGRDWSGFLYKKIIKPPSGSANLVLSGDANECISKILENVNLTDLFEASTEKSGFTLIDYEMDRYVNALYGINKMLKSVDAKMDLIFDGYKVILSASGITDYSTDEEWDSDQITYTAQKSKRFLNHIIGGGSGEGTDRLIAHWYQDGNGKISTTEQTFTGIDEVEEFYDYSGAKTVDEMDTGARQRLKEAYDKANYIDGKFTNTQPYAIGDIVGVKDQITGITMSEEISSKVLKAAGTEISLTYKVGS